MDDKAVQTPFKNGKIIVTVPEKEAPEALAFVLKCESPEEWFNGPGGDFWIDFKPMDPDAIGALIVQREVSSTHWSILERMRLVNENIKAVAESPNGLAWIYVLLRFNQMKLVPVSRRSNYQSKDLAHTQDSVSRNIAGLYGRYPAARMYARLFAGTVPRGGGNGDAVRLEILDIMRRHGIKEGHRPGIEDHFIEQWHQKLHTNCAPDDLIIVDAYIRFLETGNIDDYWNHLKGNGLSW
jgi:alpha-glucan,water dikinase